MYQYNTLILKKYSTHEMICWLQSCCIIIQLLP
uniref:Uncharacterized protein n=1 Tax=Arundo donax TaxID=35708 RepID=A0A0A9HAP4_ARUDO